MVLPYNEICPSIHRDAFVAATAAIVGRVRIGPESSVWYGAVLRGDVNEIAVGARTSVQDGAVLHCDEDAACTVGDDVTVGHNACVHGCEVGDGAVIGIGASVLSRARVGEGAVIAAGALVPEGAEIPPGMVAMGVPARAVREVTAAERERFAENARHYVALGRQHAVAQSGRTKAPPSDS
jgi:carbonic anhydrase/acetyltransferase-like protein (isoleucine patch superfamily)